MTTRESTIRSTVPLMIGKKLSSACTRVVSEFALETGGARLRSRRPHPTTTVGARFGR